MIQKIVIVAVIGLLGFGFVSYQSKNSKSNNVQAVIFNIQEGDDIVEIGKELADLDLVDNRVYFYYYVWQNKLRGKFKADQYEITPQSSIAEIVYKITRSDEAVVEKPIDIKVTFPEGWTIKKMADRLNSKNLPGDEFAKIALQPKAELYAEYSFLKEDASLEGYLFPDTYLFLPNATAQDIIEKMLNNFDLKVDQGRRDEIARQGKTLHDLIIFASIVEGEVPSDADRGIVAGVFKNRLDIGQALESDATIDYIKGISEIKHTLSDIQIDSPYNTYKYAGLPFGPINNPSLASIDAAIAPSDTDYMYFLNNATTGETVFSRTFAEHILNKGKNGL